MSVCHTRYLCVDIGIKWAFLNNYTLSFWLVLINNMWAWYLQNFRMLLWGFLKWSFNFIYLFFSSWGYLTLFLCICFCRQDLSRGTIASSFFYRCSAVNMLPMMFNFAISKMLVLNCLLLIVLGKGSVKIADFFPLSNSVSLHNICPLHPRKCSEDLTTKPDRCEQSGNVNIWNGKNSDLWRQLRKNQHALYN